MTFRPERPEPVDVDPEGLSVVRDGLYLATHDAYGTSSGVFGSFPVPVAGKTGTAEKVVDLPGYGAGHLEDQSWWCGWGPFDLSSYGRKGPIVVCAVIENGGHGGTAAAPAALKVFERWFGVDRGRGAGRRGERLMLDVSTTRSAPRQGIDVLAYVRRLDWLLVAAVGALVAYGLWAVSGITRYDVEGNESYYVVRQAIAVGLGLVALVVALAVDPDRYRRAQRVIYGSTIVLMILVFLLAQETRGSKRWIDIGPFQLQPSEFGKLLFVLALAGFLADRARRLDAAVVLQAVGLALIPILLVFKQPDLGTSLVYTAALAACLFVAGARWTHMLALAATGLTVMVERRLVPADRRRRGARAVPEGAAHRLRESGPRPGRHHVQRHAVDHRGRLGAGSTAGASPARPRRGSTTFRSTRQTSSSPPSRSSAASSAPRSCSGSTCSSSGAGSGSSRSAATRTARSSRAGS